MAGRATRRGASFSANTSALGDIPGANRGSPMTDSQLDLPLRELLHQREWLSRLAAALVRDPHAAEDAAQQTWLQALVAKTPLRDGRAWLSAVLGNVVR